MKNIIYVSAYSPPRTHSIQLITIYKNQPKLMASFHGSISLWGLTGLKKQIRMIQNGEMEPYEHYSMTKIFIFHKEHVIIKDQFFEEKDDTYIDIKDFLFFLEEKISFSYSLKRFSREQFFSLITNKFSLIKKNHKKYLLLEKVDYIAFSPPSVKTYRIPFPDNNDISIDFFLRPEDLALDSETFSKHLYFNEQILFSEEDYQKPL